jgi:hypothetical protein
VIGRRCEGFGCHLASVYLQLLFKVDKTMLAANSPRNMVIVALAQRVFRTGGEKLHHFTLAAVFNSFGHRPSPVIVVPTFSGAEELFAGQNVFVPDSRSGRCTVSAFDAFAGHFCACLAHLRGHAFHEPPRGPALPRRRQLSSRVRQ